MVAKSQIHDQRVLVTGGHGFLGREVCRAIVDFHPQAILTPRRAEYDLTEQSAVRQMLDDLQPDVIVHLAAVVGGIGANRENPGRFFYQNAAMGLMLMEEARLRGVKKFVVTGTICSYPKHTQVPFQEADLWLGYPEETNAPYGLAKKMLLVQAQAYRQQFGFNAITLLPVNLYGPGDNFAPESSHVIPALIKKMLEARDAGRRSVEVWGTGTVSREFLYVSDAARGIALAADRYDDGAPCNLGSGREIRIRELVEMIAELCGYEGELRWDSTKPDGQPRRCLETSRARHAFGFEATTDLKMGLRRTIEWYDSVRHERS